MGETILCCCGLSLLTPPRPTVPLSLFPSLSQSFSSFSRSSSNGKAGTHTHTHTCHISSWRSQLFLASVHLREVCGLPEFLSVASCTQVQLRIVSLVSRTPRFMYVALSPLPLRLNLTTCHPVQTGTVNKQHNMAHQEAPHRPGS